MNRFVDLGRTRGGTQPRKANGGNTGGKSKMVAEEKERTAETAEERKTKNPHSQTASPDKEGENIDQIVLAVAQIIKPLIKEVIAEAMQITSDKIREELHMQDVRMGELEERLLAAEEDAQEQRNKMQHMEIALHTAWDTIDDLEN